MLSRTDTLRVRRIHISVGILLGIALSKESTAGLGRTAAGMKFYQGKGCYFTYCNAKSETGSCVQWKYVNEHRKQISRYL